MQKVFSVCSVPFWKCYTWEQAPLQRTCSIRRRGCFARWPGLLQPKFILPLQRPGSEWIAHFPWWQINQTWFLGWDGYKRTTTPPGPKVSTALLALIRVTKGYLRAIFLPARAVGCCWKQAGLVKEKGLIKTHFSCDRVLGEPSWQRKWLFFSRCSPLLKSKVSA